MMGDVKEVMTGRPGGTSGPDGYGYRLLPVKITPQMIESALEGHYGKRRMQQCGGAAGVGMTVNGRDYNGIQAMKRMWAGALAAAPTPPTPPVQQPVTLRFPTMLRKMWSGGEVQDWLDKQGPLYAAPPAQQPAMSDELRQHILHMRSELTKQDRSPLRVRQKLAQRVTELLYASPAAQQSQADELDDLRDLFEITNPMPEGVIRYQGGYIPHTIGSLSPAYSFIKATEFIAKFAGYKEGLLTAGDTAAPEQRSQTASVHDNLLDVVVSGVTEGERIEALARWLEQQQHFRPDVMSIAAADLRALYRRAKDAEQAAQYFAEHGAVKAPRELLERALKKWSTHGAFTDIPGWQGPFDELRALLGAE